MSFRPQRDKPLPKGLVHGITSIVFESALQPAEPPEQPTKSKVNPHQSTSKHQKENDDERKTN